MKTTMKTYFASHKLGRAATCTADADAIVQRVNSVTASNGDSLCKDRVQDEIDALADAKTQELFRISVEFSEVEIA